MIHGGFHTRNQQFEDNLNIRNTYLKGQLISRSLNSTNKEESANLGLDIYFPDYLERETSEIYTNPITKDN